MQWLLFVKRCFVPAIVSLLKTLRFPDASGLVYAGLHLACAKTGIGVLLVKSFDALIRTADHPPDL